MMFVVIIMTYNYGCPEKLTCSENRQQVLISSVFFRTLLSTYLSPERQREYSTGYKSFLLGHRGRQATKATCESLTLLLTWIVLDFQKIFEELFEITAFWRKVAGLVICWGIRNIDPAIQYIRRRTAIHLQLFCFCYILFIVKFEFYGSGQEQQLGTCFPLQIFKTSTCPSFCCSAWPRLSSSQRRSLNSLSNHPHKL